MRERDSLSFGPIPSRRLGRSLGINNIPPKHCSYSCVYCQVGRTDTMIVERREFFSPEDILGAVKRRVKDAGEKGMGVDYLTFVPDGEPALDINLGREIEMLRPLGIKIAVISNSSLMAREDVREDLGRADWVSLKVDAVTPDAWRRVDRPHKALDLGAVLEGVRIFSAGFKGTLATETMLVRDVNDSPEEAAGIADFIRTLSVHKSYLAVPTRPPAEKGAGPAGEKALNAAFQVFVERGIETEYLVGYEGNAFAATGDAEDDLLSITAVHPMREDAVRDFLLRARKDPGVADRLVDEGRLARVRYKDSGFYVRRFS